MANTEKDALKSEVQEILKLKEELKLRRRKRNFSGSKLRKFFPEVKRLKEEFGFSFEDIALWLRQFKRVKLTADGVRSAYRRIEAENKSPIFSDEI